MKRWAPIFYAVAGGAFGGIALLMLANDVTGKPTITFAALSGACIVLSVLGQQTTTRP